MLAIHFSDLVVMTAGEISQIPVTHELAPDEIEELVTESNLQNLASEMALPTLRVDEIAIAIPVHFHLSPRSGNSLSGSRLMTTLPSPLVPKSVNALSHFRVTLKLNPLD
ncbi:hypothetical protein H6F90_10360 [Trichocoleus sp. FACHB-591]|uniref:hypothetical protein n=1 Tax=Trichocoleus sp. FACHB-591 TaxID=2692872 RepID=UPI001686B26F|nr:hypothetical protein [Trichocoleus sp. FACHB-591]MBD2095559.1 hypothetical protein [Trichocoleus sp. FACHB-591]